MEETEESFHSSVAQEHSFSSSEGDLTLTNDTTCRSPNQDKKCSSKQVSDAETDPENAVVESVQDIPKQVFSSTQDTIETSPEISVHNVPCILQETPISPSSPNAGLVPTTNRGPLTQQLQEQLVLPDKRNVNSSEEASHINNSFSVGDQLTNNISEEGKINFHFAIHQDEGCALSDEDSCDAAYVQSITNAVNAFNQQYQDKREEDESSIAAADSFSPQAFFSSIPLFKKLKKKRLAATLPKHSTTDEHSDQYCSDLPSIHALQIMSNSKPDFALLMHDSNQGVPIAPRPDPDNKVSCYVLVVPAPLYYETVIPQESIQLQQDQPEDTLSATASSESEDKVREVQEATPEVSIPVPDPSPMHPPDWTPKPPKPVRMPLPSTRVRVSPSPHRGSRSSPIITVSTTTTPIYPLQGNKQQYVIVQGNNRHLKGLASYKDSFCTPTVEESHQPIYLQGLPPQGFRRLWKAKENGNTERTTKRSLAPLFSQASGLAYKEATVPQSEKSPLTCIRSKLPCDREVPDTDSTSADQRLPTKDSLDVSTPASVIEETSGQDLTVVTEPACQEDNAVPLDSDVNKSDIITITPISHARGREDKEKKKLRDRKYDADLKKVFEKLRRVVPRMQKSYSRGLILQETIKYIGVLENKILDAGLWSTLQEQVCAEREAQSTNITEEKQDETTQELVTEVNILPSPMTATVPELCDSFSSTAERTPTMFSEDEGGKTPLDNTAATLSSPIILSLSTEEGPCAFGSPEEAIATTDYENADGNTVVVEEVPLTIPIQQIQFLPVDPSDVSPVLMPQSPDQPLSQEPYPRLIPVVDLPGHIESNGHLGIDHSGDISPQRDVLLSAMTTISHEGLSDLGVTLSPLLSPLGILLSPGGDHGEESTIAVVVEDASSAAEENVVVSSGVMSDICTDMTSVAASVEVTTDQRKKWSSPSNGRTRRSPRTRAAQTVPSVSPLQVDDSKQSTPRRRGRRVLQDHSNFEDVRSPVVDSRRGRRRKLKDRSPQQSAQAADENSGFAANISRTPPGRVSGVILSGGRKTPSSRGGDGAKRMRRI